MTLMPIPASCLARNRFIELHHRHHEPVRFHKYSIGATTDGKLVGVCIVERQLAETGWLPPMVPKAA